MEPHATAEAATPKMSLAHMVMDVVSPPPVVEKPQASEPPKPAAGKPIAPATKKAPAQPVDADKRGPGIGFAIAATVIIVLGLAALATYAYLKTV